MRRRADLFRPERATRAISLAACSSAFRVARRITSASSPPAGQTVAARSSRLASTRTPSAAMARAAGWSLMSNGVPSGGQQPGSVHR